MTWCLGSPISLESLEQIAKKFARGVCIWSFFWPHNQFSCQPTTGLGAIYPGTIIMQASFTATGGFVCKLWQFYYQFTYGMERHLIPTKRFPFWHWSQAYHSKVNAAKYMELILENMRISIKISTHICRYLLLNLTVLIYLLTLFVSLVYLISLVYFTYLFCTVLIYTTYLLIYIQV